MAYSDAPTCRPAWKIAAALTASRDAKGRIYIGDVRGGKVFRIDGPGAKPVLFAEGFKSAADIVLDGQGRILVPDSRAGTLSALPIAD